MADSCASFPYDEEEGLKLQATNVRSHRGEKFQDLKRRDVQKVDFKSAKAAIAKFLQRQDEVVSYTLKPEQQIVDVGLQSKTNGITSSIQRYCKYFNLVPTFYEDGIGTVQHKAINMLETDQGVSTSVGGTVHVTYTPKHQSLEQLQSTVTPQINHTPVEIKEALSQEPEELHRAEASMVLQPTGEQACHDPALPPSQPSSTQDLDQHSQTHSVQDPTVNMAYLQTVAHIWDEGKPHDGTVHCIGRVNLASGDQIEKCSFPGKKCSKDNSDQTTLICNVPDENERDMIPAVFNPSKALDTCLIPLRPDDVTEAMRMRDVLGTASPVDIENKWDRPDTRVFVVYGQYAPKHVPGGRHVLKATITRPDVTKKLRTNECDHFYGPLIEYALQDPDVYKTQGGDCGIPVYTVVGGKARLVGFHVAAKVGTEFCYAVPAKPNMEAVLNEVVTPEGYTCKTQICVPTDLKKSVEAVAAEGEARH